mgnify:CR=1 FL=1
MKNWHNFLLLENLNNFTKLSIFDFDETIAFSDTITNVTDKNTGESFQATTQEELDKLGLEPDKYEFDFSPLDLYIVGLDGQNKGEFVLKQIIQKYPNIKEIEFYDDSLNNIIAMQMTKEIAELEKFHIYHVEHGKPKLIK